MKNKLFFFANWEGTFERVNRSNLFSVPTADFRTGDFSRMLGGERFSMPAEMPSWFPRPKGVPLPLREGMIFDPFSGNLDGTGRSVFASGGRINAIPSGSPERPDDDRCSTSSRCPIRPATSTTTSTPEPSVSTATTSTAKSIGTGTSDTSSCSSTASWTRWCTATSVWVRQAESACATAASVTATRSCRLAASGRPTPSRRTSCSTGRSAGRDSARTWSRPTSGRTSDWTCWGSLAPTVPTRGKAGCRPCTSPGIPTWAIRKAGIPLYRNDQSFTFNTNASWTKGEHDIRFGFDFLHHSMKHWQPELGYGPRGAFSFDPGVTALNPEALDATVGFQDGTPSFENDWNGLGGISARHPHVLREEQPVHRDDELREPVRALRPRPLAAEVQADARSGTALGALPQPDTRGRSRHRVVRPDDQRGADWRPWWHSPRQRRGLQQEAVCSPARLHVPVERGHGRSKRLRDHVQPTPVGRSGVARVVPADARGDLRWRQRLPAGDHRVPATSRRVYRTHRWGPTSVFHRSAAPTSARAGFRCPAWPRPVTRGPISSCTAGTSSRGT